MRFVTRSWRLTVPLGTRLYRRAVTNGLIGGDIRWRRVLVAMWAWRLVRRIVVRQPRTVAVEHLRTGQTVIVTGTSKR